MKILVDINHPAHVHFFKIFIREMRHKGHDILITASKKDIAFNLLKHYGFNYIDVGSYGNNIVAKLLNVPMMAIKMCKIVKQNRPNILLGIASSRITHVAWFFNKKSFVFTDTEHATGQIALFKPFATKIVTPQCFIKDFGKKHIRYKGYHELAYLHPNRFKPNVNVLREIGVKETDKFFIVRFISWGASHDIGQKGFTLEGKRKLINLLSKYGKTLITSESELSEEFKQYRMNISPIKIHDLLYYSSMYIGEGGTMASESAVLGTPSIFISSLTLGYLQELEQKYKLMYNFTDENEAIAQAENLLNEKDIKKNWGIKRQKLINDCIDVTSWMVDYFEKI